MPSFADMLGYLRKSSGLSQKDLAKKIGVSRSAIGMYETGEREPDFETLEAIADTFNVNMDTLLGKAGAIIATERVPVLTENERPFYQQTRESFKDIPAMTVGEKIKMYRKQVNLTQTELGERLGVQKNAVSKWECGRVDEIPLSKLKAMAAIFGISPIQLTDWEYAGDLLQEKPYDEDRNFLRNIYNFGEQIDVEIVAKLYKALQSVGGRYSEADLLKLADLATKVLATPLDQFDRVSGVIDALLK